MNRAPSICQGDNTCDTRQAHICYNDADPAWLGERPWEGTTVKTCEETVVKDGQPTMCGKPLDAHGQCEYAGNHC